MYVQGAGRDSERVIPCTYGQSRTTFIRHQQHFKSGKKGGKEASRQQAAGFRFILSAFLPIVFSCSNIRSVVTGQWSVVVMGSVLTGRLGGV